jgi:hypothetical protein
MNGSESLAAGKSSPCRLERDIGREGNEVQLEIGNAVQNRNIGAAECEGSGNARVELDDGLTGVIAGQNAGRRTDDEKQAAER